MSRTLVASLGLFALLAGASSAGAREFRFFDVGDRVYYESFSNDLEPIVEPHVYLPRAVRAFGKGHLSYAAQNLEKAAAGFEYFSERAAGEDRRQLDKASRALSKLARQVRRGEVDGVHVVEEAVADAQRVLAGERVMPTRGAEAPAPAQS